MKIRKNSRDLLVIEERTWLVGLLLALYVAVFAGIGGAMLWQGKVGGFVPLLVGPGLGVIGFAGFVRHTQAVFRRADATVELRDRTVVGCKRRRFALAEVERAIVEENWSSDGETYRVALVVAPGIGAGAHPLTPVYSARRKHERLAAAINAWLATAKTA